MGDGRSICTEAARALDHHVIARLYARLVDSKQHLGHGAVDRGDSLVGQLIWDFEDEVPRLKVEILGKAAIAVGVVLEVVPYVAAEAVLADVQLAPYAVVAAHARKYKGESNPIALPQGAAQRVGGDIPVERVDVAAEFVARNAGQRFSGMRESPRQ
jgi:hypothetical protein